MSVFRHASKLLLVFSLVLSTQSLLVVQFTFWLRQEYVAEQLCVNRFAPELECEGICYLKERMKEAQERQREERAAALGVALSFDLLVPTGEAVPPPPAPLRHAYGAAPSLPVPALHASGVFRPPRPVA